VDLEDAFMNGAHLQGAFLNSAHLEGADLDGAELNGAHLEAAFLNGAILSVADLGGAFMNGAHLDGVYLNDADLSGAHLDGADLSGAHLNGAHLDVAELTGTYLDFDPDSLPKVVPGIYTARNLQLVKFSDQPAGLIKLRGEFKGLGVRTQESQLTYAIRRSELIRKDDIHGYYLHGWSERALNTVFFDWTCQYGMSPGRPLLIVAALATILSIVYIFAQVGPGPNGGIWAVWDEHRIKPAEGSK
jgi:Pentapeptide repeats (8 copies)